MYLVQMALDYLVYVMVPGMIISEQCGYFLTMPFFNQYMQAQGLVSLSALSKGNK